MKVYVIMPIVYGDEPCPVGAYSTEQAAEVQVGRYRAAHKGEFNQILTLTIEVDAPADDPDHSPEIRTS